MLHYLYYSKQHNTKQHNIVSLLNFGKKITKDNMAPTTSYHSIHSTSRRRFGVSEGKLQVDLEGQIGIASSPKQRAPQHPMIWYGMVWYHVRYPIELNLNNKPVHFLNLPHHTMPYLD